MSDNFDYEGIENDTQIPLAKATFKSSLVVIRRDVAWLAQELASTMDTPDDLDMLIVELQKQYEELLVKSPRLDLDVSGASDNDPKLINNR